ncbi:MAG: hypothetical protein V3571_05375 [Pseudodesulfovibrio sp.]
MRTLISTLLLLALLTVAALAQDAPPEPDAAPDDAARTQEAMPDDPNAMLPGEAPAPPQDSSESAPPEAAAPEAKAEDVPSGPIGELHMADGAIHEILALQKFGKFYFYLSGKLDGRTTTVLSPTRLEDVKRWAGIAFQDQNTLTIVTKGQKQLLFTDAHLYLGSDDPDSYSFMTTDPNTYEDVLLSVKKADVKTIAIK